MNQCAIDVLALATITCALLKLKSSLKRKRRKQRRYWIHPLLLKRKQQGYYENLLKEMQLYDEAMFFNFTRMSIISFHKLLGYIGPFIKKKSRREPISPDCRLAVTLRFLATGDSYPSLGYAFRIGIPTVHSIIKETCSVIWTVLSPMYLKPPNQKKFLEIASEFYNQWQLPNCVGSIDGKHVVIQAPANSGSVYYNYKKSFSIVLLAVCDANYKFTFVDIGAYGSQSDGGILNASLFGRKLFDDKLDLPPDHPFPRTQTLMPFYFIGDEAFPLRSNLMRPFSNSPNGPMNESEQIFNYRISRARRVIENTFGILVARFRIFHRVINAAPDTVDSIIKACVCLHNFIRAENNTLYFEPTSVDRLINGTLVPGRWRNEIPKTNALHSMVSLQRRLGSRNASQTATAFRNDIKNYVNNVVPLMRHGNMKLLEKQIKQSCCQFLLFT